jgi:hypothetical protein
MNATEVVIRGPQQAGISDCPEGAERREERAPQHLRALQRANQIRLARAEIKRRVAFGELNVIDVLLSGVEEIETMEIAELLTSQRRWGHTRARRFLAAIPMTESKAIGSMTERQLATLASMLSTCAPQRSPRPLAQPAEHATL